MRNKRSTTSTQYHRKRRHLLASMGAVVSFALALGFAVTSTSGPADAAAGSPGIPSAPTVLYEEDFENGSGLTALSSYVADSGMTYTASAYWLNTIACNGFVISYSIAYQSPYCHSYSGASNSVYNFNATRAKAYALGLLSNPSNAQANRALSTNTSPQTAANETHPNEIMFSTASQLNLALATGRFLTFSVDAAATYCPNNPPLLRFYYRDANGVETPISSSAINPCTDSQRSIVSVDGISTAYGRYVANGSALAQGTSVGIVLRNEATGSAGGGNDGAIDNIRVLDATPQLDKQFSPTSVESGGVSTLTFTVTNTSELSAKNGWSFTDTLPSGLTIANPANVGGTCNATIAASAGASTITVSNGILAAGTSSCTVTVQVTSSTPGSFTNNANNVTVTGLNPPGSTTVTFSNPSYTVQKRVSSSSANPGSPITYTVDVTNTGLWAYDDNAPAGLRRASFTDDLSDVLDDATYNNDASGGASVVGNTLTWSGTLAVGETRSITYSVTPKTPGAGNLVLENTVTPTGPGGTCVTGECSTSTPVQALQISKTSDPQQVFGGTQINYTITLTNTGAVAYTAGAGAASFTDDLSSVLDDATYNNDATASAGSVSYSAPTLSWSGPIAVGQTVTVLYSVTVKNPVAGNSHIDNTVTSTTPGNNCPANSTDPACVVQILTGMYTVEKTATSGPVYTGDVIGYTVTVRNTGAVAYTAAEPASFVDDLSAVLDDATYNNDATNGASVSGTTLTWSGDLAVGEVKTITYSVTVKNPDTGDRSVLNVVEPTGPGGSCAPGKVCTTTADVFPPPTIQVQKVGEDNTGTLVPMDGSEWAIYTAPSGGTAVISSLSGVSGQTGLFTTGASGIPSGTYWLQETQALSGFQLLAQRVQFAVSPTGVITLGAGTSPNVTVTVVNAIATIRVVDVPHFDLPTTGGTGTTWIYVTGGGIIIVAITALVVMNLRKRRRKSVSRRDERAQGLSGRPAHEPSSRFSF